MAAYDIFADESGYSDGRFRSIAAVSAPAARVPDIQVKLQCVLDEHGIEDFKWREIRSPKTVKCAKDFIDCLFRFVANDSLRVDVVVWDTEDARHAIEGRDDIKNYERMFFHLHRSAIKMRENDAEWHFRPDEQLQIDWPTIHSCLSSRGTWTIGHIQQSLPSEFYQLRPQVKSFKEVDSATPLCQLADLMAGVARYTRWRSKRVLHQLHNDSKQSNLFNEDPPVEISSRDKVRFQIIDKLYYGCLQHSLGVSLKTNGYFITKDPKRPVNFWHYKPQHGYDRAPTRGT